jgi:L,D-transpeptidase ErfK/SrfK
VVGVLVAGLVGSLPALAEPLDGGPPSTVVGKTIRHTVQAGEDLWSLARKYTLSMDNIMLANGLPSLSVKTGDRLLIPTRWILPGTEQDGLIVNLPERTIYVFEGGELAVAYPCAVGQGGRFATPTGDFTVVNKQEDPIWTPPSWSKIKKPIPPGPDNPLGDRWIGLSADGVGIHATNDPMSIGAVTSHGCMRTYPWIVHELFDTVQIGWPVHIVYEPIKLGWSAEDRTWYMSVFPDIYHQVPDMGALARTQLDKAGLLPLVDDDLLKHLVEEQAGVPTPVAGSDVVIKLNNQRLDFTMAPLLRGGQVWASGEMLRSCGLSVRYDPDHRSLSVMHDGDDVSMNALEGRGQSFVPLSMVLSGLNVRYKWDAVHRTFLIFMKTQQARG